MNKIIRNWHFSVSTAHNKKFRFSLKTIIFLHINIKTSISKLLDEEELDINIGKKVFKINISKLKLLRNQTYIIYKKGIQNIDINNIYNDNDKSNIIVHITICV